MKQTLELYQPQAVWHIFHQIPQFMHAHQLQFHEYLINFAKSHQLEYQLSRTGNLLLSKKASSNETTRRKVMLHVGLNLAPAQSLEPEHNGLPTSAYSEGDWFKTKPTADRISLALALAIASSSSLKHNDLEILLTTTNRDRISSANDLGDLKLNSQVLINLNHSEDDEVSIGCAGSVESNIYLPITRTKLSPQVDTILKLELKGLLGGHSGLDISLGRANAIKEMALLLSQLHTRFKIDLIELNGGSLKNIIPSSCTAVIALPTPMQTELEQYIIDYTLNLQQEYQEHDPNLNLIVTPTITQSLALSQKSSCQLLAGLSAMLDGVWRLNYDLNIAESSTNLSIVTTELDQVVINSLQRSSQPSVKAKLAQMVTAAFAEFNATCQQENSYSSWQPNFNSEILLTLTDIYRQLFNDEIFVGAVHGDLDCGMILAQAPHLDAISLGTTIRFTHSSQPMLKINSITKSWQLLTTLLEEL